MADTPKPNKELDVSWADLVPVFWFGRASKKKRLTLIKRGATIRSAE